MWQHRKGLRTWAASKGGVASKCILSLIIATYFQLVTTRTTMYDDAWYAKLRSRKKLFQGNMDGKTRWVEEVFNLTAIIIILELSSLEVSTSRIPTYSRGKRARINPSRWWYVECMKIRGRGYIYWELAYYFLVRGKNGTLTWSWQWEETGAVTWEEAHFRSEIDGNSSHKHYRSSFHFLS